MYQEQDCGERIPKIPLRDQVREMAFLDLDSGLHKYEKADTCRR
jgi:hypothetical protein